MLELEELEELGATGELVEWVGEREASTTSGVVDITLEGFEVEVRGSGVSSFHNYSIIAANRF